MNNNTNKFRFSTKRFEEIGELYYYGFRFYKPKTGNWLTRDPIAENGGENLYIFINNNPIANIDLLGMQTKDGMSIGSWIRSLREIYNGYKQMREFIKKHNQVGVDKKFHCITACKAARAGDKISTDTILRIRELGDLLKHRLQRLATKFGYQPKFPSGKVRTLVSNIEAAQDALDDMKVNQQGMNCPANKTCECCCENL